VEAGVGDRLDVRIVRERLAACGGEELRGVVAEAANRVVLQAWASSFTSKVMLVESEKSTGVLL